MQETSEQCSVDEWAYYQLGRSWLDDLSGHRVVLYQYRLRTLHFARFKLTFCLDALSLSNLMNIHNEENLRSILRYFTAGEFTKHDYSNCLKPGYTIPGLIASLVDACTTSIDGMSYAIKSDRGKRC